MLHIGTELVYELAFLVSSTKLEELLDDVVAKHIGHEAVSRRQNLLEDQLFLVWSRTLQLLLNESGAMLILTKLHNVVGKIAELKVWVAIVPEILQQS